MNQAKLQNLSRWAARFAPTRFAPQTTDDLSIHIFHHNSADIDPATCQIKDDPRVEYVNLDTLPLPHNYTIPSLPKDMQRTAYGEYLGLMSIKPHREMIACFPYTTPYKFSYAWARLSRSPHSFLPQFDFADVLATEYRSDCLYAAELSNPSRDYPELMADIHERFKIGTQAPLGQGPMKGSLIVSSKEFLCFQEWLQAVTAYIAKNIDLTAIARVSSAFSTSSIAYRTAADSAHDAIRHGLGNVLERATAYYFAQRFPRSRKKLIGPYVQANRNRNSLQHMLRRHAVNKTIYVVFGNSKYTEIIHNWVVAAQKQKIFNFLIVALDAALHKQLVDAGIPTVLEKCSPNLADLWARRVRTLREIVDSGYSVIHSDADAVLLKDPTKYIGDNESDFIFTQGTIWPAEVFRQWGFVLCCGFFKINATDAAKRILHDVEVDVSLTKDDQVSFNRVIAAAIPFFEASNAKQFQFNDHDIKWSTETMTGRSNDCTVSVLPHNLFPRIDSMSDSAIMKHIYSPKTSGGTRRVLIDAGCWQLPPER